MTTTLLYIDDACISSTIPNFAADNEIIVGFLDDPTNLVGTQLKKQFVSQTEPAPYKFNGRIQSTDPEKSWALTGCLIKAVQYFDSSYKSGTLTILADQVSAN